MAYNAADDQALPDGTIIDGRYLLEGRLGRGGFAWVYEAHHTDLERPAAVKLLDPPRAPAADSFRKRFMREAKIVARLSHPNIVTVYDFGMHEATEQPYIAMELLKGHDLEDELRTNGPLDPARAKRLFVGAAEALRVAHAAGVVHKDLKPSNLFIADPDTPSERLVLLDFGIALTIDDESRITKVGAFTGTPAYVAPEYARTIEVTPAVDVYQLGLILSESLSGVPCVDAQAPMQMILAHCNGDIVIPDTVANSPFGEVIAQATAFDPADRHGEGGALAVALDAIDVTGMARASVMRRPGEAVTAQHAFEVAQTTDQLDSPVEDAAEPQVPHDAPTMPLELEGAPEPAPRVAPAPPHTTARTSVPPPKTRMVPAREADSELGWGWYIGGAFGLAVIGSVVFISLQPEPPTPVPTPTSTPNAAAAVQHEPAKPDAGSTADEPVLQPRFTIASTPIGAVVYHKDERLGRTPVVLRGDRVDGSKLRLRVELSGHKSRHATVELVDGGRLDVELKPIGGAKPAVGPIFERGQPGLDNGAMQKIFLHGVKQPTNEGMRRRQQQE